MGNNTSHASGQLQFHHAAGAGDLSLAKKLVRGGIDINSTDTKGWTALVRAARNHRSDVVRYLVDQDANKEAKANFGNTALTLAAQRGHVEIVRHLVEQGADKDAGGNNGATALIWAACIGHLGMMQHLVNNGANKDAKNKDGDTAMTIAAGFGHLELVACLIDAGAGEEIQNNNGWRRRRHQCQGHLIEVIAELEKYAEAEEGDACPY